MIHTHLKHFYSNVKHINWHSFANLWCKAEVFSLNWRYMWSLLINHILNASPKIFNFIFFTLEQELKWLAKQSDWIIFLNCYNFSPSPSQFSQPHEFNGLYELLLARFDEVILKNSTYFSLTYLSLCTHISSIAYI